MTGGDPNNVLSFKTGRNESFLLRRSVLPSYNKGKKLTLFIKEIYFFNDAKLERFYAPRRGYGGSLFLQGGLSYPSEQFSPCSYLIRCASRKIADDKRIETVNSVHSEFDRPPIQTCFSPKSDLK